MRFVPRCLSVLLKSELRVAERPVPPEVDRLAGSRAAVAARRDRAQLKLDVARRRRTPLSVLEQAARENGTAAASLRVTEFLRAIPGIGKVKSARLLQLLSISPAKRLGGLGVHQRERLSSFLHERQGSAAAVATAGSASPTSASASHRLPVRNSSLRNSPSETAAQQSTSQPGRLLVLAGPTAVGKGTVSRYIREHHAEVALSVSATTRSPRPGEIEGEHYYFVDDAAFERMVEAGELLEYATVHGAHRYGTPRAPVERALASGRSVLLEIDLQGARQLRAVMPEALLVFLAPPSWEELVRRLQARGSEDAAERELRLATARVELAAQGEFDRVVVNDRVEDAAQEVVELMSTKVRNLRGYTHQGHH